MMKDLNFSPLRSRTMIVHLIATIKHGTTQANQNTAEKLNKRKNPNRFYLQMA